MPLNIKMLFIDKCYLLRIYFQVFQEECSKENMVNKYGNKIIRLSSANTHSYRKRKYFDLLTVTLIDSFPMVKVLDFQELSSLYLGTP